VSLYLFMVLKGVGGQTVSGSSVLCLLSLSGAGSFLGNALLHELRPARRFDLFYLVLAAGGVAGGLCTAFLFPALLSRPFEFITISTLLLIAGASRLLGLGYSWRTPVLALLLAAPVLVLVWRQDLDFRGKDSVFFYRNLFGSSNVRLEQHGAGVVLTNETTAHGSQLIQTPEARRHPTLYYSDSTPAGVVLQRLQADRPAMQVGVIGLGAGTLAAYSRAGDTYRFWDIDPKALEIARRHFFYLSDARGKVETVLADGRRGIRESKTDFDLLLIDAFSGDGIPAHLVTTEAINLYFQHLLPRNGLLLIHASNRNSDLFPVVAATARRAGYSTLNVSTEIRETAGDRDWDPTLTHYIIVCRHEHIEELISWFPLEEEGARVRRTLQRASLAEAPGDLVWTDDRNSSLEMLNLKAYLTPQ